VNVSAAITIFVTIAIAGAIVVPFVLMLVRKRAEHDDPRAKDPPVPRSFVITISVFGAGLIFGFAGPAIFPNTWWGALMGTLLGKALYVSAMLVLVAFLLPVLQALGLFPKDQSRSTYVQGSRWRNHDPK
jgi:hypothetical protein